jgi:hypothetical protein
MEVLAVRVVVGRVAPEEGLAVLAEDQVVPAAGRVDRVEGRVDRVEGLAVPAVVDREVPAVVDRAGRTAAPDVW